MIRKLRELFRNPATPQAPRSPVTPLEILMPEGRVPLESPKLAGKLISLLVASPQDTTTIEFHSHDGHVHSTNNGLRQFLALVAGAKQSSFLESQCKSIMFQPSENESIGSLGCMQQGRMFSFSVIEHASLPNLKWEFRRIVREVEK